MQRFFKYVGRTIAFLFLIAIFCVNCRLFVAYVFPELPTESHLNTLKKDIRTRNVADEMQNYFPEGFVFSYALYGLIWLEYATQHKEIKFKALQEADFALAQLVSEKGKSTFVPDLPLSRGVFYRGWVNYVRAKRLGLSKSLDVEELFFKECDSIYLAYRKSEHPYLESYPRMKWPADNMLAIASLALHDRMYKPKYTVYIKKWLRRVNERLDSSTQLIPHNQTEGTGALTARGSSQALITAILQDIDSNLAEKYYRSYIKQFSIQWFGLPFMREFRDGRSIGDIDSGPVIFGIGAVSSVVVLKSSALHHKSDFWARRAVIETFSLPITFNGETRYLLGQMPMLDLFLTWVQLNPKSAKSSYPFMGFHFVSLFLMAVIFLCLCAKKLMQRFVFSNLHIETT